MNQYKNEIGAVLQNLIDRCKRGPLDKNSAEDKAFLEEQFKRIFEYTRQEYFEDLGNDYQPIYFKTVDKDNSEMGGFVSRVQRETGSEKIVLANFDHHIQLNLFVCCSDRFLGSNSVESRIGSCIHIIDTMKHEFTHYLQSIKMQSLSLDSSAVEAAKQETVKRSNDIYDENYWIMSGEVEARINGYEQAIQVLETIGDKDKIEEYRKYYENQLPLMDLNRNLDNVSSFNEAGKNYQDKNYFFNQRADEYIKNNPGVLDVYKVLQYEYNMDGSKKSVSQMLEECYAQIQEVKQNDNLSPEQRTKMRHAVRNNYFDLLASRIDEISIDEAKKIEQIFGKEGSKGTGQLYKAMKQYYVEDYYKKRADFQRAREIYMNSKLGRVTNMNSRKFDEMVRMFNSKYERIFKSVDRLSQSYHMVEKSVINGVDLPNVEAVKVKNGRDKKTAFVEQFVEIYDKVEDEESFKLRKQGEYRNISMIINAVNTQRCVRGFMESFKKEKGKPFTERQILIMMRCLKAADNITIVGGENYLQKFADTPFVNSILHAMRDDPTFIAMKEKSEKMQIQNHQETEAEIDKKVANTYLSTLSQEELAEKLKLYSKHEATARSVSNDEWKNAVWRITARQQGFRPNGVDFINMMTLSSGKSSLVTTDDLRALGMSEVVKKIVINGKEFEAIKDNSKNYEVKEI